MATPNSGAGSVAVKKPHKSPLGWIVPVALLLLLIIAAVVALLLFNANDEGDDPDLDISDDPQAAAIWEPSELT
jgi:tryptophan-rich sensory protein